MRRTLLIAAQTLVALATLLLVVYAQTREPQTKTADVYASGPIMAVGHGAMLDHRGNRIEPTPEFIADAQRYYLDALSRHASKEQQARLAKMREGFDKAAKWNSQETAYANHAWVRWLIAAVNPPRASTLSSINAFLRQEYFELTNPKFRPSPRLLELLPKPGDSPGQHDAANGNGDGLGYGDSHSSDTPTFIMNTNASGPAYIAECQANGVPTPPDWGSGAWVSKGLLSVNFLAKPSTPTAEVFSFTSNSPLGVCIALPRSSGSTIKLLGIICLGKSSGKACFWDNQSNDSGFPIQQGVPVPLSQFAGGAELEGGSGGECTDCHAGENPFIVHPGTGLAAATMMPNTWYKPLVHPSWLQNPGPTNLLACVPLGPNDGSCLTCHSSGMAGGGRFPAVSTALSTYCGLMGMAMNQTMPPGQAGSTAYDKHKNALLAACSKPPGSFPADADLDCVADSTDNCKFVFNPQQEDQDGDGVGNACDNCVGVSNGNQLNTDGDSEGDACDADDDNDFCPDTTDDKPTKDSSVIGFKIAVNCPDSTVDVWGWDGEDSDGDGKRNCEDADDDNDGTPDATDKCPVDKPVQGGIPDFECNKGAVSCPFQVPWDVCMFGGCNEFLIKILALINPDPLIVVEKFRIVGKDVYLEASENQTIQQIEEAVLAQSLIGRAAVSATGRGGRGTPARNRALVRMEIWSRDKPGKPGRRLATIAEYDPRSVDLISQQSAPAVKVTPVPRSRGLVVTRTTIQAQAAKRKSVAEQQQ